MKMTCFPDVKAKKSMSPSDAINFDQLYHKLQIDQLCYFL